MAATSVVEGPAGGEVSRGELCVTLTRAALQRGVGHAVDTWSNQCKVKVVNRFSFKRKGFRLLRGRVVVLF